MTKNAMDDSGRGISRRTFIGSAILSTAAMSGHSISAVAQRSGVSKRRPNFVFIMADDMGAFDLSCYGRLDYKTPNIDSLARDGMKFDFGYANSSTCTPTRTALISGRYQNRLLVGSGLGGGYTSDVIGYPAGLPSLPSILKTAGYRTALVGKWDLGELPTFSPNLSGYDEFFGLMGGAFDYWTHDMQDLNNPSRRLATFYENDQPIQVEGYATDLFSDRACNFIARNAAHPFLLSLHYNAPHWPWQTRTDRGLSRMTDLHFSGGSPAIYRDMVLAMDEGVGKVLDTLRKLDLTRDTLVVFTSDNGGERFSKMWPLRGGKGDLWEGGTRVPLIASWPGRIPAGSKSIQVAMSMDFLPTFASMAGAKTDPEYMPDGIDLSPQLYGADPVERTVFWKTPADMLSALTYPWKYLRIDRRDFLYNIEEDPTEHANYKLRNSDMFAQLKTEADTWSASMMKNLPSHRPSIIEALEALDPLPRK
ncbi:sulfatase-like hydrolase/transferase [Tardibacter chloracetimidivorans]|nr:sulfatase-like hydrolase/transferase [Tardibacter chloracetimidivorans]